MENLHIYNLLAIIRYIKAVFKKIPGVVAEGSTFFFSG
jgi:hypothetical protein